MYPLFKKFALSPKRLFFTDGLGALLTAFNLFVILKSFKEYIGMPTDTLNFLSIIAVTFSVYSFSCFYLAKNNWYPFLFIISVANLLYCILTIGLVVYNYAHLKILGLAYFLLEIVIICCLLYIEINVVTAEYRRSGK